MKNTMKAVVYDKPGRKFASIREVHIPKCGDDEVLISVKVSGICKGADGDIDTVGTDRTVYPITPGHEFGGIIAEMGKDVKGFSIGDRVTVDPPSFCGKCEYCRSGEPDYCTDIHYIGNNNNGSFAEYVIAKSNQLYKVPENLSLEEISFSEPVACCVHAIKKANIKYGETVVVLGSGCSGIIMAQLLKHSGASDVIVIAGNQKKLDLVNSFGIDTIKMDRKDHSIHENKLHELYPLGVNVVIDTTGSPDMIRSGFKLLRKGGRFVQYGVVRETLSIDVLSFWCVEKSYITSACEAFDYPEAIMALEKGWVDVKPLITKRYKLNDYFEALDEAVNNTENLKVLIVSE